MQMVHDFFLISYTILLREFDRFQTGKFNKLKFQLEEVDLTDRETQQKVRYSTLEKKHTFSLMIVSQQHTRCFRFGISGSLRLRK